MALRALAGFVAFLVLGNLLILLVSTWAQRTTPSFAPVEIAGIHNFEAVDAKLWRGGAPSSADYESLAAAGVRTVVDLRAEDDLEIDDALLDRLGIERVAIPIRDGQTPTPSQVDTFLAAVKRSTGPVYVHCGAGVGRTGAMVAAYSVNMGETSPWLALRRNLAVGPPSLEQVVYAAAMDDTYERPNAVLVAVSRTLDAPRRIWKSIIG